MQIVAGGCLGCGGVRGGGPHNKQEKKGPLSMLLLF